MRLVVDMQPLQTGSRFRGVGRYTRELVKALARRLDAPEIILVLNGSLKDTIEEIRSDFLDIVPQDNIRIWYSPELVAFTHDDRSDVRKACEVIREYFIMAQQPDAILIPNLFEGLGDDVVLSVGRSKPHVPVVSICHDLIPLVDPAASFQSDRITRFWYRERLEALRNSDLVLANSRHSRDEALSLLGIDDAKIVTIGAGHDAKFRRKPLSDSERIKLREELGITKPFVMFAGSLEASKNVPAFLSAMGRLPARLQDAYQIVVAGKREPDDVARLLSLAPNSTIRDALRIVGHVTDDRLVDLYNCCEAFVFPSKREGFGLPPLEAMACGAPTIVANSTSLPEVVADEDALFDPDSTLDMALKIEKILTDKTFRQQRIERGLERAAELNWDACASSALQAMARFRRGYQAGVYSRSKIFSIDGVVGDRKRILISKLDHAGDFILALPAMAKIRARYPKARIDALVGGWNKLSAEHSGLFDNVYTLDFFKAKSSVQASIQDAEIERIQRDLPYYDYAIDLRRHSDTRFILLALRARMYFGYQTGNPKYDDNLHRPLEIYPELAGERGYFDEIHISEQMLRIVDTLPSATSDYVNLPTFSDVKSEPGTVGIFPRVGSDARQWDSDRFVELVARLCATDFVTEVNIFGVNQREMDEVGFLPNPKIRYHSGLPFVDLVSQLGRNRVCVGNNSFGVHLGSLLGCQTVAIYSGHEMPEQWAPAFGSVDVVTANVECSPCHLPTKESCPYEVRCLTDIDVETVFAAVRSKLLGGRTDPTLEAASGWSQEDCFEQAVRSLNRLKFQGEVAELSDLDKGAIEAALLRNFPLRSGVRARRIYLDISRYVAGGPDCVIPSGMDRHVLSAAAKLLADAMPDYEVIFIGAGEHDHEFYETSLDSIENFYSGNRVVRIVYPMAGDVYFGVDRYIERNAAQWDLLQGWREGGIRVCFSVRPSDIEALPGNPALAEPGSNELKIHNYLVHISSFDALIFPDDLHIQEVRSLIVNHGLDRKRPVELFSNMLFENIRQAIVSENLHGGSADRHAMPNEISALARALSTGTVEARFNPLSIPVFQ